MSMFTPSELDYLRGNRLLARIATVGPDGMPHVTPVGWSLTDEDTVIEINGRDFAATKKYRDVARSGKAAVVIDDVQPPFRPRGVEIRGRAEAVQSPEPMIRLHPTRIIAWGEGVAEGGRHARSPA